MRIVFMNGSPKVKNSASQYLLEELKYYVDNKADVIEMSVHNTRLSDEMLENLSGADVWVFAFPLYVDGIPAHLLSFLTQLAGSAFEKSKIHVYGLVNCGFYEGIQNELALEVLQNWCTKTGCIWAGGVGIGGGGALAMLPVSERGQGPMAPINHALSVLAVNMMGGRVQKNAYTSIGIPRLMYKLGGQWDWRKMIKANGGRKRDLDRRL